MTVKKEVIERCEKLVTRQISENQFKLKTNRAHINALAKEQRVLKAQIGMLYKMKKDLTPKKVSK